MGIVIMVLKNFILWSYSNKQLFRCGNKKWFTRLFCLIEIDFECLFEVKEVINYW